jgi:hypothetical protein
VTRQRGGTTRRRDDDEGEAISSAEEIGRLLKDRRQERALDLSTVHDRLNRPITQLEALENGDLASLPDQALALSTLRRYAALLELDGDALALQMIDAWSALPPVARDLAMGDTGATAVTNVVTAVATGPEHLRAFTQTGEVPKVGGGVTGSRGGSGAYRYGVSTGPPTGTFPVVPRQDLKQSRRSVARARRKLRAPGWLKASTWIAGSLVVVIIVGFGLLQWRSNWLVQSHIIRVVQPGGTHPTSPNAPAGGGSGKADVVPTTSSGQSSAYTVSTSHFTVVLATSGRCWIQVTSSQSATPLASGVQDGGKTLVFPAKGTMTVQVGSSSVVVGITVHKKNVFYNAPQTVPYMYTFTPASGA